MRIESALNIQISSVHISNVEIAQYGTLLRFYWLITKDDGFLLADLQLSAHISCSYHLAMPLVHVWLF
jgi:hypothetical protein